MNSNHPLPASPLKGEEPMQIPRGLATGNYKLIMDYAHQLRRRKKLLKRQTTLLENAFYLPPMELSEFIRHPAIRGIYHNLSESTRKRDMAKLAKYGLLKIQIFQKETRVSANRDALKSLTLRLDNIPHRPSRPRTQS